jgi:hypothetical protein
MSGWFRTEIVQTGRLPLACFFVVFLTGFCFIRLSVRMIRAKVRWWPGNVTAGDVHIHHMVFGVVFMVVAGVAGLAAPLYPVGWRAGAAGLFGLGTALVLDEFALILHLRDVYWTSDGRVSIDAVFIAAGITALLLLGATPVGVEPAADTFPTFILSAAALFVLAAITLLKGKIWTAVFGLFLPPLFLIGAIRLARPGSPWARWRYRTRPARLIRAAVRERRLREPVNQAKIQLQNLLAGKLDRPAAPASRQSRQALRAPAPLSPERDPGARPPARARHDR